MSMDPTRPDPVSDYIREQPDVVAATLAAARAGLAGWTPARAGLVLVGSGSSMNALLATAPTFTAAGRGPVLLRNPQAFLAELDPLSGWAGTAVILSQSGASRTSIAAARAARDAGMDVLVVTGEAASPIAALGLPLLVMPIGPEPIGPKTKGFGASIAAMLAVAERLGAPLPGTTGLAAALRGATEPLRLAVERFAPGLAELDFLMVAGQGRLLGIAVEGSLKVAEMAGIPAAGFDTEEAMHGRFHGLTRHSAALFLAGDAGERAEAARAVAALDGLGIRAAILDASGGPGLFPLPALPPPLDVLAAVIPLQWLAWFLARRRGIEPDRMRYPGMSQKLAIKTDSQP
ncbi:hypothetical protein STVA_19190 [Allostella vacuolata]|nr:hypothetical protein STVA_19190 [Stella vacuolata]